MKSNDAAGSPLLPTRMTSSVPVYTGLDDPRERSTNAVMLLAVIAAIVALYAAMFASVYLWSRHAPIFPPDTVENSATVEAMPWTS
jgi:hypothetical protein